MEERERESVPTERSETAEATSSSSLSVPEREPEAGRKDPDEGAEKIDVCSDKFDPVLALYSPTVPLPFPNVKCFNNVSAYESFLKGGRGRAKPENVEKKRQKAMKGVADPERIARLKKLMVNNPVEESEEGESSSNTPRRRRGQKPQKNVLTRMPLCAGSPLGELYRCVQERIRVKVHIRTFKGLRGVCSGFVVAFDKFWNMAMVDVDETYREPLLGEALYHEKALTITRLFEKLKLQQSVAVEESAKKQEVQEKKPTKIKTVSARWASSKEDSRTKSKLPDTDTTRLDEQNVSVRAQGSEACQKKESQKYGKVCTRHVNQLFIRGENVILVNPQPL
ncbi:U7 snRNA-associated Sm-like protein LSm11 [Xyrichtys novacula]|uniref:U7 snRNA-associated Sm-like protein LSm11 n=1 Tax=Xyrichtys novacula TaxID=13765 RepID=A0AAV1FA52_XYRNO|nr:U7 snRNA-associated Sm-like protein LSm11 [Xyrichtys novacula]